MYRLIVELTDPFIVCLLLLGLAVAGLWRGKEVRRGRLWFLTLAYLGLVFLCLPPVAFLAVGSLEWAYPPLYDLPENTQAIVVLGGRVDPANAFRTRPELDDETVMRCLKAAQLYRENGPSLVAVSGGNVDPSHPGPTCAKAMSDFLVDIGVAPDDLVSEGKSRTTHENALETRRLLKPRGVERIVLVTSATHLRRSVLCYRAQGFDVTPRGCCHRATEFRLSLGTFLPSSDAAHAIDAVVHEWIGLAWYWMHGRF